MPIPDFNRVGLLPAGVHNCDLDEIAARFTWNTRREEIWAGCRRFLRELAGMAMTYAIRVGPRLTRSLELLP